MAINKIDAPGITPATFWPQVIDQLLALTIDKELFDRCVNGFVKQGSLFNIGGSMFLADSDTAIGGTQSTAVAVKFVVTGSTATATYVDSMTGVTWNGAYSGYYDGSSNFHLPIKYAGNYIINGSLILDEKVINLTNSYVKYAELRVTRNGFASIKFESRMQGQAAQYKIQKNGVDCVSETGITVTYFVNEHNLYFSDGDLIQIYMKYSSTATTAYFKKLALCGSEGSVNYDYL